MNLKRALLSSCIPFAMVVSAVSATAAPVHQADSKAEANTILREIQSDAADAAGHAYNLQSFEGTLDLTWQSHAIQLEGVKDEINDMGVKLARLESIRNSVAPAQRDLIDRTAATLRLMADNTQDALVFGNANQKSLWLAKYQHYVNDLCNEANSLTHSVESAGFARAVEE